MSQEESGSSAFAAYLGRLRAADLQVGDVVETSLLRYEVTGHTESGAFAGGLRAQGRLVAVFNGDCWTPPLVSLTRDPLHLEAGNWRRTA